jgi:hypothetical protein
MPQNFDELEARGIKLFKLVTNRTPFATPHRHALLPSQPAIASATAPVYVVRLARNRHTKSQEPLVQVRIPSVMVEKKNTALHFYTAVVGFVKSKDIPMGPTFRWLTATAPEGAEGGELLLEPVGFAPAETYQRALFAAGIPATAFLTSDIQSEYRRLKSRDAAFRGEPTARGPIIAVLSEDTCGNLINLVQPTV